MPLKRLLTGPPLRGVHFTFGSGRLAYDCASCGAQCCRGHGFLAREGAEVATLLNEAPELLVFLERGHSQRHYVDTRNLAPGCFFLDASSLCRLHAAHGEAAKPETCRLFPFNDVLTSDGALIVRPHMALCPLWG